MKIILFTQYFWPETFDINGLARSLKRKGVETEIITAKPNYPGGQIYPGYSAWGFTRDTFCDMPVLRVPIVPRGNTKLGLALNYISYIVFHFLLIVHYLFVHLFLFLISLKKVLILLHNMLFLYSLLV